MLVSLWWNNLSIIPTPTLTGPLRCRHASALRNPAVISFKNLNRLISPAFEGQASKKKKTEKKINLLLKVSLNEPFVTFIPICKSEGRRSLIYEETNSRTPQIKLVRKEEIKLWVICESGDVMAPAKPLARRALSPSNKAVANYQTRMDDTGGSTQR